MALHRFLLDRGKRKDEIKVWEEICKVTLTQQKHIEDTKFRRARGFIKPRG